MTNEALILPRRAGATRWVLMLNGHGFDFVRHCAAPYRERRCSWTQLIETVPVAPPSAVVLVDPRACPPISGLHPRLPELLEAAVMVPVVTMVPIDPSHGESIRRLVELGVGEIADARFEATAGAIQLRFAAAHAQPLKKLVEPALSRFVSARAMTLIRGAAEVVVDRGQAGELAKLFDSDERTITTWCAREGLPTARRLLAWMRVLLALGLLKDPRRTVGNVAACCGYTDHSLRRVLREFLGGPAKPRERSLAEALAVFNSELRELREKGRRRRP